MTDSMKSILLIEDSQADIEVVRRFLAAAGNEDFRLASASTLAEGRRLFETMSFDLILLDQNLPDSLDGKSLEQCLLWSAGIPIIVLTGVGDEEEGAIRVRQGAQDYLVKGSFDAALLMRVVRYTVERHALQKEMALMKLRDQKATELKSLEAIDIGSAQPAAPATKSLRGAAPAFFSELIQRYEGFLEAAIEQRVYKQNRAIITEGIRTFTSELARYGAGPREIVEIHSTALERRLKGQNESRTQAYLEEARLILLETMGALVQTYRSMFTMREGLQSPS